MKLYTEMDINAVYVLLGLKCNFNCLYCSQKFKDYAVKERRISARALEYIRRLAELQPAGKKPLKIILWGGEPLLYFETIRDIVDSLKGVGVVFGTVTNGSLITQEMVNFFNEHDVSVAVSNDGVNSHKTRGVNILEDKEKLALLKQIRNVGVDSVISAYNDDFLRTLEYVQEKFDREVGVSFEWLMCSKNTPAALYDFDYACFDENSRKYLAVVAQSIHEGQAGSLLHSALPEINKVLKLDKDNLYPHCGAVRHVMNMDLDGNLYACHPGDRIGSAADAHEDLLKLYSENYNNAFWGADCSQCEYVYICKAGCPLEAASPGKRAVCKAKRIFYKNLLGFVESFGGERQC